MAETTATAGFGTLLKLGDAGSPETFTSIAETTHISGPGFSVDTADVTHHESPGGWEEVIPTIIRSGQVTFDLNFLPAHATHKNASGGLL